MQSNLARASCPLFTGPMLKEWIQSIMTRTEPIYRQLGYVYASVALQNRYARCRKAWSSHIENCHRVILENVPEDKNGMIVVVGSGPLLEVPWRELLERCEKLVLVDVVHPPKVERLAKKEPKVELRRMDVTGFAAISKDEKKVQKLDFKPPVIKWEQTPKAVISANILSQLSLEPYTAAQKKWPWVDDQYFAKLAHKMSVEHVAWIKAMGAPDTLLIADCERTYFTPQGEEMERVSSAGVLKAGQLVRQWEWLIAPLGEVSKEYSYSMSVECRRL